VFVPKVHEEGKAFQVVTDDDGNVTTIAKITHAEIMKLTEANLNAISDLLLSMEGNSSLGRAAFDIVRSTICPEYPNGNAQIAWLRLEMKYAPSTTFALSTLYTSRLKKGWDPDVYMTYLGDIRMQMADMRICVTHSNKVLVLGYCSGYRRKIP
jgi:hypothetical protein